MKLNDFSFGCQSQLDIKHIKSNMNGTRYKMRYKQTNIVCEHLFLSSFFYEQYKNYIELSNPRSTKARVEAIDINCQFQY